jgi:hypothetical protein
MGTSTDGLLWYGVAIDGSPDDGDELAEKILAITDGDPDDEDNYLYGDGREWLAEHGLTGVEFVDHCSYEYPMYGIAVAGTLTRASRGYPRRVDPTETPDPAPVIAVMAALGAPVDADAVGWHLASMWG